MNLQVFADWCSRNTPLELNCLIYVEECAELIQALSKSLRHGDVSKVAEECADVLIMTEVLRAFEPSLVGNGLGFVSDPTWGIHFAARAAHVVADCMPGIRDQDVRDAMTDLENWIRRLNPPELEAWIERKVARSIERLKR